MKHFFVSSSKQLKNRKFCTKGPDKLSTTGHNELVEPAWKKSTSTLRLKEFPQQSLPYDGATAAAYVAYAWSENAFIYPITPATPMGDAVANWSGQGRKNIFGSVVNVTQMQSEGGAAGACHGVVDVGSLATTFTSSQGLLLMIPNMYIIAGALNPCVFHVAARSVTKHALCIFGDHTDVMATRQTGFAQLSAFNVQECQDMGLVSHISTIKSSIPFMNFFDGFRTSHEINRIDIIPYDAMETLVPWADLNAFRRRGLIPNRPHSRQLGQFADTFFQNSEASNKYFDAVPSIVQQTMDDVGRISGRYYKLFEYFGHSEAEYVTVVMGSGVATFKEIIQYDNQRGQKYGMIAVRLFRPWDTEAFLSVLPRTAKKIIVLDRTKEQMGVGEPLFVDVSASLQTVGNTIKVVGGRYGLGSKEFTPSMARGCFENLKSSRPVEKFSIGIEDDVTYRSIPFGPEPDVSKPGLRQCIFWGMGSDGTVSANKSAIKMIAENTDLNVQAYFAYDSKKAGGCTISHLRFGPSKIDAPYAIMQADYIAASQRTWPQKFPRAMLEALKKGGTCVFNSSSKTPEEFIEEMPQAIINQIGKLQADVYTIDANKVARECGLGRHTNNVLASVFFKLSKVLPFEQAESLLKQSMRKSYASKGEELVQRNLRGVDASIENLEKIEINYEQWANLVKPLEHVDPSRPPFVTHVMDPLNALEGNHLPVSYFDPRGHFPLATAKYEKRGVALTIPIVDMDKCTQCNKCSAICPHAAIRPFLISQLEADNAPLEFDMRIAKGGSDVAGHMFRIQVAPEDCTGCEACSYACPDDALTMTPLPDVLVKEKSNWTFAINLPNRGSLTEKNTFRGSQFQQPLLEFSGACEGCGETPYAKLVTQLFGERMVIANASGCSSVWAGTAAFGSLSTNEKGQGPAWGRSLFEDAAEYGLGMARALNDRRNRLEDNISDLVNEDDYKSILPVELIQAGNEWIKEKSNPKISQELSETIPRLIQACLPLRDVTLAQSILNEQDLLPKVSIWIWGGDGWAYDIGFGGLDHVLASKTDLNVLVMDTEGYSNTGGQVSKSTNLGSVQKFAPTGYRRAKKDLGAIAMSYEDIYVASIAIGANYSQSVKALVEAEAYPGPSLILAYSPCIEHKILFPRGLSRLAEEMSKAVESGYWSLYRYNPSLRHTIGQNSFSLDSKKLTASTDDFTRLENRFQILARTHPDVAKKLKSELQVWAIERHEHLRWTENKFATESLTEAEKTSSTDSEVLYILYGSDTGTTAELSQRLSTLAKSRSYKVKTFELDEVSIPEDLAAMENIMILCSTAGEGDMPANAHAFWENLSSTELSKNSLEKTKISVFGLGDTSYKHFNAAAKNIETRMVELGAVKVMDTGMGNDRDEDKYETALESWLPEFWKVNNSPPPQNDNDIYEPLVELVPVEDKTSVLPYIQVKPPKTRLIPLESNIRLTPVDYDRCIRHLVFNIKGKDFSYLLGDALNIYPTNDPSMISDFLKWYNVNEDDLYQVTPIKPIDQRRRDSYRHPMSPHQIFSEVVDILGRPNKNFYKELAKFSLDKKEKDQLTILYSDTIEGQEKYSALVSEAVTYYDILQLFPSAHPPIEHLMSLIPCIKPRLYSIASSQRLENNKIELAIVILDWKTPSGKSRRGLSTDFIERTSNASTTHPILVPCSITTGTFTFPKDNMTPYIMTGLGTGLAPFRAFVQDRAAIRLRMAKEAAAKASVDGNAVTAPIISTGPMWLFYGCRHKQKDFIFGDELEEYQRQGVITQLRPAFSRDQNEKVYVQDRMKEVGEALYQDLVVNKGFFYLCGQAGQLEKDIDEALITSFKKGGVMDEGEAKKKLEEIHIDGRFSTELY